MPRYTQHDAETLVFTFKDGLLARFSHDLEIRVTRFSLDIDPVAANVTAEFDPSSLEVLNARPKALSDRDKRRIATQIQKTVLETVSHTKITFNSTKVARRPDGGYSITGDLTLHGSTRAIRVETRVDGGRQVAEVRLNQPDFGVVPHRVLLGALKVKPEVRVRVSIPND